jgi:branched-chain amino acid transport system permease protein
VRQLRDLRPIILTLAAFVVVAAGVLFFGDDYHVNVATNLMMWIALSESWTLFSGLTGYVSLGHAVFFGLGGYLTILTYGIVPLWAALALSGVAATALAVLVGLPCFRVRGPYFVILTFGLSEFVKYIVVDIEARASKFGRMVLGGPDENDVFLIMVGLAVAAFMLSYFMRRSRLGAGLRAIREDEVAAETAGVPTARLKLIAFGLSALIPGITGGAFLFRSGYFEPVQAFNPSVSLSMITMAVIGGTDDAYGPLIGAVALVMLSEVLWANAPELYMIILGLLLVIFVLWMPDGIEGQFRRWLRLRAQK